VFGFNLRFPGQYYDEETELVYNYFRYYDPNTGRYITSDPIGLQGGLNTNAYVDNNPLRYIDPYGLSKFDKLFGLPKQFWNWYHRQVKRAGDPDLTKDDARYLYKEWQGLGKPKPDSKGKQRGFIDPDLLEWLIPWPFIPSELGCGDLDCNGITDYEEENQCK
jgi:RHS repeat-associated protein